MRKKGQKIDAGQMEILQEAIDSMSGLMRKVISMADEDRQLVEVLRILDFYGRSSSHLSNLLKTQSLLSAKEEASTAIDEALAEVLRELGLEKH